MRINKTRDVAVVENEVAAPKTILIKMEEEAVVTEGASVEAAVAIEMTISERSWTKIMHTLRRTLYKRLMITQMVKIRGIARKQPTQEAEEALVASKEEGDKDKDNEEVAVVVARGEVAEVEAVAEAETTHGIRITKKTLLTRSRVFEILIPKIS